MQLCLVEMTNLPRTWLTFLDHPVDGLNYAAQTGIVWADWATCFVCY